MSLDVYLQKKCSCGECVKKEYFDYNITHNLNHMAEKARLYRYLWRPEELNIKYARFLVEPLQEGLRRLRSNPDEYKKLAPKNGWGSYEGLVVFVEEYLKACKEFPDAEIIVSR